MKSLRPVAYFILLAWFLTSSSQSVMAEFPGLASAIKTDFKPFAAGLTGRSVLVSLPDLNELNRQWRLTAAIETEIVAQLLQAKIVAVDVDDDERFLWLARTRNSSVERWQKNPVYDVLVTGGFQARQVRQ